ncbi:hypothetical protein Tco_0994224 [Tanacetum coccineum]
MGYSSCSAAAEKILRSPSSSRHSFDASDKNRGLPRLLDLEDPSEEYPPASSAKGPIWEFSHPAPPDTSLKSLRGMGLLELVQQEQRFLPGSPLCPKCPGVQVFTLLQLRTLRTTIYYLEIGRLVFRVPQMAPMFEQISVDALQP